MFTIFELNLLLQIIATKQAATEKAISAVPKYLQQKPFLETNFDFTPTALILEKCLDPRSPNVDMPRTPILVIYLFFKIIFKIKNK